jgi:hypothetical protein
MDLGKSGGVSGAAADTAAAALYISFDWIDSRALHALCPVCVLVPNNRRRLLETATTISHHNSFIQGATLTRQNFAGEVTLKKMVKPNLKK